MSRRNEFGDFFRTEYVLVIAFLRKLGFDHHLATEAASQAMAVAYTDWAKIRTNPRGWVRTAAHRLAIKEAKAARTKLTRLVGKGYGTLVDDGVSRYEHVEQQELLLQALALLSPQQRRVMAWHLDGFTSDEIATLERMRQVTVRSNLRHAREKLRHVLEGPRSGDTHERR